MTRTQLRVVIAFFAVALLVAAFRLGLFGLHDHARVVAAVARVRGIPLLKPAFVIVYALASSIGVPASPLTLAGGALFGVAWGVALNWLGCVLGALLGFAITRALKAPPRGMDPAVASVVPRVGGREPSANGFATLFRLRVIPFVPFAMLNVAFALGGMSWRTFASATALGVIPVTIVYTVFAASLLGGASGSGTRALVTASVTGTLIIAASFAPALLKRGRS